MGRMAKWSNNLARRALLTKSRGDIPNRPRDLASKEALILTEWTCQQIGVFLDIGVAFGKWPTLLAEVPMGIR
jgi:hypothetical protein